MISQLKLIQNNIIFKYFQYNMKSLRNIRKKDSPKKTAHRKETIRPFLLRVLKEWNEWEDIPGVIIEFPKGSARPDLFNVIISPNNGYWVKATFKFRFEIPETYPIEPPAVTCLTTPIYHPNIDIRGNICLNLLRSDWRPINTFENIIYGLILLFESPNFNDPLPSGTFPVNMEPFQLWQTNEDSFKDVVEKTIQGGTISKLGDIYFPRVSS